MPFTLTLLLSNFSIKFPTLSAIFAKGSANLVSSFSIASRYLEKAPVPFAAFWNLSVRTKTDKIIFVKEASNLLPTASCNFLVLSAISCKALEGFCMAKA